MSKKKSPKKNIENAKKQEYLEKVAGAPVHGEVVSWRAAGPHPRAKVVSALEKAGLNKELVKDFLFRHGFSRACRQMEEDRSIDLYKEDGNILSFQFTKKFIEKEGVDFKKEVKVTLNKETGVIECSNQTIKELATAGLAKAMDERTTSDVTRIVQKLFEQNSDLIPIRDQGGAYLVPHMYTEFTERISVFLGELGGRIARFPIAAGTAHGDAAVQESVTEYMRSIVQEAETAIAGFGLDTRMDVLERQSEKIKRSRTKLEAYALLLGEYSAELTKTNDELLAKTIAQIEAVAAVRKDSPKSEPAGKDAFGTRLGTATAKVNAVLNGTPKTITELRTEAGVTQPFAIHLAKLVKEGKVQNKDGKYWIETPPTKEE